MNSDRPHSNPEQACFAMGCSFDAYIAGVGAGRDDLIGLQDARDYVVMRNAQGAYRDWAIDPQFLIDIRGPSLRNLSLLQEGFEDWARSVGLNIEECEWDDGYVNPATRWAWRAWQARDANTSTPEHP